MHIVEASVETGLKRAALAPVRTIVATQILTQRRSLGRSRSEQSLLQSVVKEDMHVVERDIVETGRRAAGIAENVEHINAV